jgi:hypothetical protein
MLIYAKKMKQLGAAKHNPWRAGARCRDNEAEEVVLVPCGGPKVQCYDHQRTGRPDLQQWLGRSCAWMKLNGERCKSNRAQFQ